VNGFTASYPIFLKLNGAGSILLMKDTEKSALEKSILEPSPLTLVNKD
jgi:hypothetical protein